MKRKRKIPDAPTDESVARAITKSTRELLSAYFSAVREHGPDSTEAQVLKDRLFEYLKEALQEHKEGVKQHLQAQGGTARIPPPAKK
jgi:lipase chaperone LimK